MEYSSIIISWCNENQGFVSAILSLFTMILSGMAIFISVITSKLPYKKKLVIGCGTYISNIESGYCVTAVNIGNRNIKIQMIGLSIGKENIVNLDTLHESKKVLSPTEETSQYFEIEHLKYQLEKYKNYPRKRIYGFIEDTEGTRYKRKLSRVRNICNQ